MRSSYCGWAVALTLTLAVHAEATPLTVPELDGVWETAGQAEIADVHAGEVTYYDVTSVSCIETGHHAAAHFIQRFPMRQMTTEGMRVRDRAREPYLLQRLPALPEICRGGGTVGADPFLNFDAFVAYFQENFANADVRGVDWSGISREYRGRITPQTSETELWMLFGEILGRFDDPHVFLSNGRQGAEYRSLHAGRPSGLRAALLRQNPHLSVDGALDLDARLVHSLNDVVLYDVLQGRFSSALQDKFQWGWASSGIGYLNIQAMYMLFERPTNDPAQVEAAVSETMERVLSDFSGAHSMIIDVRQNRGGSDLVGRTVASYFADRTVTNRWRARTRHGYAEWFGEETRPANRRFEGNVFVLVSDNTVSAGESFAILMDQYVNVTLVGTTTRGALSAFIVKQLPNGWSLAISNYQDLSPRGERLEGRGVAPDIVSESYHSTRLLAGYREPIDAAVRLALRNGARRNRRR